MAGAARADGIGGGRDLGNLLFWLSIYAFMPLLYLLVPVTLAALFGRAAFFAYRKTIGIGARQNRLVIEVSLFTFAACALLATEPQVIVYDYEQSSLTENVFLIATLVWPLVFGLCLIYDLTLVYKFLFGRRFSKIFIATFVMIVLIGEFLYFSHIADNVE
jgi:hypothetical protein